MIIFLYILWLLAGFTGALTWTWCFGRHWERLQSQKRRNENGVLRLIALTALKRDTIGIGISVIILMVLIVTFTISDTPVRLSVSRTLIVCMAAMLAFMGFQTMRDEEQIMDKIRDEYLQKRDEESI